MPEKKQRTGNHRLVYTIAPFILLLAVLFILNWLPRFFAPAARSVTITAASPTRATSLPLNTAVSTSVSLSPESSATATTIPTPTLPPTATIQLLGPPQAAIFAPDTLVTFYWQWPLALAETHQLTAYLVRDGEELALGSLTEPNVGVSYRLQTDLKDYDLGEQLFWQVKLEDLNGRSLRASELRLLVVSVE